MEIEKIIELIHAVSESRLTSFSYEEGNIKLNFSAEREIKYTGIPLEQPSQSFVQAVFQAPSGQSDSSVPQPKKEGSVITSPMVGTFYAAPSEGAEAFVSVGDRVKKGQVVGIVEAMKLMNEIESPYDGVVEEILVQNKDMIGFGQELMRIVS